MLCNGFVVYEGPPLDVVEYLGTFGHSCPSNINVADFALDATPRLDKTAVQDYYHNYVEKMRENLTRIYNSNKMTPDQFSLKKTLLVAKL